MRHKDVAATLLRRHFDVVCWSVTSQGSKFLYLQKVCRTCNEKKSQWSWIKKSKRRKSRSLKVLQAFHLTCINRGSRNSFEKINHIYWDNYPYLFINICYDPSLGPFRRDSSDEGYDIGFRWEIIMEFYLKVIFKIEKKQIMAEGFIVRYHLLVTLLNFGPLPC